MKPRALVAAIAVVACGGGDGSPDGRVIVIDSAQEVDAFRCPVAHSSSCNVLLNTGCNADQKCAWVRYSTDVLGPDPLGSVGCVPSGDRLPGESCTWGQSGSGTGYDDCVGGAACVADPSIEQASGTCGRVCSVADGSAPCSVDEACIAHDGQFQGCATETPLFGTCEPSCDPLTQRRATDGAASCGSVETPPERGCYGLPSDGQAATLFTCYEAGDAGGHLTPVPDPVVVNSCNPGSIPLLYERSGSMQIICTAFCRPAPTNVNMPASAGGTSPYACADVGATAPTEECRFLWFFESLETPLTAASDAFGLCVDYTKYTWDRDGDPSTPEVTWTSCRDAIDTDDGSDPDADIRWGCVPSSELSSLRAGVPSAAWRPIAR